MKPGATNTLAATNIILSVANLISNLTPGTTYYFQFVANNSASTRAGANLTFTTLGQAVNFSLTGVVQLPGKQSNSALPYMRIIFIPIRFDFAQFSGGFHAVKRC
jgi:hypothetical protein